MRSLKTLVVLLLALKSFAAYSQETMSFKGGSEYYLYDKNDDGHYDTFTKTKPRVRDGDEIMVIKTKPGSKIRPQIRIDISDGTLFVALEEEGTVKKSGRVIKLTE